MSDRRHKATQKFFIGIIPKRRLTHLWDLSLHSRGRIIISWSRHLGWGNAASSVVVVVDVDVDVAGEDRAEVLTGSCARCLRMAGGRRRSGPVVGMGIQRINDYD